jgi:DNA replication protein DnaC
MNRDPGGLALCLKALHLSSFAAHLQEATSMAESQGWSYQQYLQHMAELELEDRSQRRIERLLKTSILPRDKTLASLDAAALPERVKKVLPSLCEGHFLGRSENILAFGLPGRGKTHLLCAIGHELVRRGHTVLFVPAYRLVQSLLVAKRDLNLEKELKKLDRFEAVIIDDIGYVQQDREEMEVLFTFLAERYERGSVLISSNLVFSQWDKIFKDSMTTAAAIDRLVHHCVILELNGQSYRNQEAQKRNAGAQPRGQDHGRATDLTPEEHLAGAEVGAQK